MYTEFYGLKEKPFEITPDPKFLFLTPVYREMLAALTYGINERRGFIAMIGEVGSGKTLMLNTVQSWLDTKTKFAYIFNSDLTFKQLLLYALCDLQVIRENQNLTKAAAIQHLNNYALEQFESGGNLVIFIDEAQNLSARTLENIRMLGNLETFKQKLVQIVLAGQPEFDKKLSLPECRQLDQRISLRLYAGQLNREDTFDYIRHRLKVAGYENQDLFTEAALKIVFDISQGTPRKINILCDHALLYGYGENRKQIDERTVVEVAKDHNWNYFKIQQETSSPEIEMVTSPSEIVTTSARSIKTLLAAAIFLSLVIVGGVLLFTGLGETAIEKILFYLAKI